MFMIFAGFLIATFLGLCSIWRAKKDFERDETLSTRTVFIVWVTYVSHAFLVGGVSWRAIWPIPIGETISIVSGGFISIFGIVLFTRGLIEFRSFKRMSGLREDELLRSGIYRWSRNPQNTGWLLTLLGLGLAARSSLAVLAVGIFTLVFHFYITNVEEPHLIRTFGGKYRRYMNNVSRYFGLPDHE